MKKRILHLTLKKKWFDLIAQGKKKEEYREYKPYWIKRLTLSVYPFDEVHFRNGYHKKSPFMRIELIDIYKAEVDFDDKLRKMFVIRLGEILKIKNWKGATIR